MEKYDKLKSTIEKELSELGQKGKLAGVEIDMAWKMSSTIKNLCKIEKMSEDDEYSRDSYDSYDEMSHRRGRGRYAKRDSMGRYSRADGYSEEGDSYGRYNSYDIPGADSHDYSREGAKDHMMSKLGKMMENANPEEREVLEDCMRKLERA